jgi:RNA 3'-terminal phosphate cyclase
MTTTTLFEHLTLAQLQERARLNSLRGIATSKALRDEIARRERDTRRLFCSLEELDAMDADEQR